MASQLKKGLAPLVNIIVFRQLCFCGIKVNFRCFLPPQLSFESQSHYFHTSSEAETIMQIWPSQTFEPPVISAECAISCNYHICPFFLCSAPSNQMHNELTADVCHSACLINITRLLKVCNNVCVTDRNGFERTGRTIARCCLPLAHPGSSLPGLHSLSYQTCHINHVKHILLNLVSSKRSTCSVDREVDLLLIAFICT